LLSLIAQRTLRNHMARERLAYLLFVAAGFAQLAALLTIGSTRVDKGGIVLLVILVAWLGRRSRTAWWLFVTGNAWLLLASAPLLISSGAHVVWGDVIALAGGSSVLLAILLSRPMRAWIRRPADVAKHLTAA
jgi:hypothetical protein